MPRSTRRQLMHALTALAGSAALSPMAHAEEPGISAGPFLVRDGESRGDGPWVIQKKDAITAKISGTDVAGRYSIIEIHTPPGRGPALHLHPAQNEWFFLLSGSIGLVCGSQKIVLKTGDSFLAPMGVPHAYVALGSETARIMNMFDPAGKMEAFFKEYAVVLSEPGAPDSKRLNELSSRYGMKVVGPPVHAADFA